MPYLYKNFAKSFLGMPALSGDTKIAISDISKFPAFTGASGESYKIALVRGLEFEIVYVTSVFAGNQVNVLRGQEGTTAKTWPSGETEVVHAPMASDHVAFQNTGILLGSLTDIPESIRGDTITSSIYNNFLLADDALGSANAAQDTANAAMPKTGGTFTGNVTHNNSGIDFSSSVASEFTDLSKHIKLHSANYGFSITPGSLNLVAPDAAVIRAVLNNTTVMSINSDNYVYANNIKVAAALESINFRNARAINIGGAGGNSGNNSLLGSRQLSMSTDTASWGGPYDDHAAFTIYPYMGGGWTTGEMRVGISNGPGNVISPPALVIGQAGITAAGNVTAYSDRRIKKNIKTLKGALEKILNLRGVSYNRKDTKDGKLHIGVIAQEIEKEYPELINESDADPKKGLKILTVSYGNMAGIFIEAIKSLYKKFVNLENKTQKLEKRIAELERKLK